MMFSIRTMLAVAGLALFSSSSMAGTTINVQESGEGGGAMSIKIDKTTVPAGDAVFKVTNQAMTEEHEMILVKLKSADQKIPINSSKHRVDEAKLKTIGEVADLKPNDSGELKAKLTPGAYLILCNIKGHYESGMYTKLTVTSQSASN